MSKIKDLPKKDRPRERLQLVGAENLSDQELLALIIEKGRRGNNVLRLAQNLLSYFGNLSRVRDASLQELQQVRGIGCATACKIKAAFWLGVKSTQKVDRFSDKISSAKDVYSLLFPKIGNKKKEYFILLSLSSQNRLVGIDEISVGTLNSSLVHPREVFSVAIKNNASKIILAHNHPSGNLHPSTEDLKITRRLREVSKVIGIKILDHIILTESDYISLNKYK